MGIEDFMRSDNVVAVVGVSRNPEKWGYKLYKFFKGKYRKVYPINPAVEEIDGDKVYPNLRSLPEVPDVVDIVVPPNVAREIVKEAIEVGVRRIWFQPGSEDEEAIKMCKEAGIETVWGACLMESIIKGPPKMGAFFSPSSG
ncbi:CoA-binding protein [Candidatus Korarchaeum cryptofilum]|jgi:predicted CoA-binding protein|uniref:CoA-binding protein n=1 Tax=Candidatus Korarchaeum cryptofilum TaxID=498846 RepID=A0A429G1T3_9CREN|nr:CoA-binding protein [Candidatus Korarchaeum cryptofilum]RSN67756.1 CoA-binding protein [Candidatus Korarchaeum cryptofilum]